MTSLPGWEQLNPALLQQVPGWICWRFYAAGMWGGYGKGLILVNTKEQPPTFTASASGKIEKFETVGEAVAWVECRVKALANTVKLQKGEVP